MKIKAIIIAAIAALVMTLLGCKQEEDKSNLPMPTYENIMVSRIKIVDKEIITYEAFNDLILKDDANDFIGFVAINHVIQKDVDNNIIYKYDKLKWMSFHRVSYSIEADNKSFNRLDEPKLRDSILNLYTTARGIFQINEFLYRQDLKNARRK